MSEIKNYQAKINNIFSIARFFAIFSVICAHIVLKDYETSNNLHFFLGRYGVITFYFLSGYFFNPQKYNNIGNFLKRKIKTIIIPWVIAGAFLYTYTSLVRHTGFNVLNLFLYIIGHKTLFYFVTCLLLMDIMFFYVKKNNILSLMLLAMFLNIISQSLTSIGIMDLLFDKIVITKYFNIFNYMGWFALGMVLQTVSPEILYNFIKKYRIPVLVFYAFYLVILYFFYNKFNFAFDLLNPLFKLLDFMVVICLSSFAIFDNKVVKYISSISYTVYLYHLIIVGIAFKLYSANLYISLLSSFIVLGITTAILYLGQRISQKLKIGKVYQLITGIRGEMK